MGTREKIELVEEAKRRNIRVTELIRKAVREMLEISKNFSLAKPKTSGYKRI